MKFSKEVKKIFEVFEEKEREVYLVGGAVRDILLGLEPKEFSFVTNALPREINSFFKNTVPLKIYYETTTIILNNKKIKITTYKEENEMNDFLNILKEYLSKRDFTINAMAMDKNQNLIDYFSGEEDLKNKLIKFNGYPLDKVNKDKMVLIKGIKLATTYNFDIYRIDYNVFYLRKYDFSDVSREKLQSEVNQILNSDNAEKGIFLLKNTNLLSEIKDFTYNRKIKHI